MRDIAQSHSIPYDEVQAIVKDQGEDYRRLNAPLGSGRTAKTFDLDEMVRYLQAAANAQANASGMPVERKPLSAHRYEEWRAHNKGAPAAVTIIRRFGKWSDALDAAGLKSQRRKRIGGMDKEACYEAIRDVHKRIGHYPSITEYRKLWDESLKKEGFPSDASIRFRWGRWRDVLKYAADREDSE
jgi:hypothetical protein